MWPYAVKPSLINKLKYIYNDVIGALDYVAYYDMVILFVCALFFAFYLAYGFSVKIYDTSNCVCMHMRVPLSL